MTPSIGLTGSHQINLPTAMALGIQLGINMPSNIDVIAAEAADVVTLDENLTPALQAAISPAKSQIIEWIEQKIVEIGANGRRKQNSRA